MLGHANMPPYIIDRRIRKEISRSIKYLSNKIKTKFDLIYLCRTMQPTNAKYKFSRVNGTFINIRLPLRQRFSTCGS